MTAVLPILALLGAPLFAVIAASAIIGFLRSDIDIQVVAIEIFRIAETPILVAIPLFTFAGYLLGESGTPRRLVRVTRAWMGWMRSVGGGATMFARSVTAIPA